METIFAQATARGRAGVAIVRISGDQAHDVPALFGIRAPDPRHARAAWLLDPATRERLDQALVLVFEAPKSFTGEDVVELHLHGSIAVVDRVLAILAGCQGFRPAEAGEFTRRALLNGRLDLVEVEGLSDLLVAETEAQRRQAVASMSGRLTELASGWRKGLIRALALVETTIDFADEEVPDEVADDVRPLLHALRASIEAELRGSRVAERIREGFEVALVGEANIGKSTLLNCMAGREAAITSAIAGTTRDVIEVRMDVEGLPVTILDMAGLRRSDDPVEILGVCKARARAEGADLRVFLSEGAERAAEFADLWRTGDLRVRPKADLNGDAAGLAVSGLTGAGVSELLHAIAAELQKRVSAAGSVNRLRQREALNRGLSAILRALAALEEQDIRPELVAEDLREALRELDVLIGKVDVEAVLDIIFASFCIGK